MIKKSILALSFTCALALANENGYFAGASFGYSLGTVSNDSVINNSESDKSTSGYNISIKGGYEWFYNSSISVKPYLEYTYSSYLNSGSFAKDLTMNIITLNADVSYYFTNDISVFAGLSLGEVFADTSGGYGSDTAFGWGLQAGWTYKILDYLELEGKYKWFDPGLGEKYTAGNTRKVQPDDSHLFSIGLNYKF
ncbi:outer membrane beta-barrel protein [uncultured Campylobacter sp.]|uniref:outer membrane beta-barrel protein n=1 Tax=uncultured Campylobacter sp. TaxID=218934 RepID=UPI0026318F94|nr:outer membrane beta-barrel protein [uncultured Campylobacter sp.]